MASIVAEPIIAAITAIVEAVVEKGVEASVIASISAAVTSVVEAAVASAIAAAIVAGITSSVTGTITADTTVAIEKALEEKLDQSVKDVIGSQGVKDLAKAISALPSDIAVNKLADAALEAINPHLWVFQDPAFFRLTKVIRALRAVERGDEPPEDDDDDDCDEEKCRFFEAPKVEDHLQDFVFLSVFGSEECKEGDEVYSMFVQMKNLKSLVEDPIGGHFVSQILQEINERCVEEGEEYDEEDAFLQAGIQNLALLPNTKKIKKVKKKIVKCKNGNLVFFGSKTIYNIKGSSADKRSSNWLKATFVKGYQKCGTCYIEEASPNCGHTNPLKGNIVGGHVWNPDLKKEDKSLRYYILPICKRHNKHNVYDEPKPGKTGWMKTTKDAWAMQIKSTGKVPGWKDDKLMAIAGLQSFAMMVGEAAGDAGECHEITQPQQLTKWLLEEVHKIALEFAKDPIDVVFKEVSGIVFGKLKEIIQSAGNDAKNWAKSEGHDIMLQSLIPFYGIYQAIKRLNSLKSDAIGRFHSEAQSALANYKNECLGDVEQARRKQRLSEETDKVLSSKKWKDRVVAFEKTIASKVPTVINLEKSN